MNIRLTIAAVVVPMAVACSSPPATFSLTNATVEPSYSCPGGANNVPYTVHATIDARNDTSKEVSIDSATAEMVLTSVTGSWLEHVGYRYDAGTVEVDPNTVAARSSAMLVVAIPSACTSWVHGSGSSSSGEYEVRMRLITSAGTFTITAANKHEIRAA